MGEASKWIKGNRACRSSETDVVLIDLAMPVMDGTGAIKRILAIHPEERDHCPDPVLRVTIQTLDMIRAGAMGISRQVMPSRMNWSSRSVRSLGRAILNPTTPEVASRRHDWH